MARECCTRTALFWHGFDQVAHDLDAIMPQWSALGRDFADVRFVDVRRQETHSGFVQQHLMMALRHDGRRVVWPVCLVVRLKNGLIDRLDEYIDRAGSFEPPSSGAFVTPGFEEI